MKRSFLTALGLEKDIIDQIMAEHGNTVELTKEKAQEDAEKQTGKLNDKIANLQEQLNNIPKPDPNEKDWKAEYDTLKGKYDTDIAAKEEEFSAFKTSVEIEKSENAKRSALRKQLEADGANPKLTALLEKEFDLSKVEIDDGKIKGWDELSKPIKETYADVFGKVETRGASVATPPAGVGGKTDYVTQLEAARKSRNTQDAVRIKTEAASEGVFLI